MQIFQCKPDSIPLQIQTSEYFDCEDRGHHVYKGGEDDREEKDKKNHESSSITTVKVILKLTSLGLDNFKNKDDEYEKEQNQATLSSNHVVVSHSDKIIPDDLYISNGSNNSFDEIVTNDDVTICDENGSFIKTEAILIGSIITVL